MKSHLTAFLLVSGLIISPALGGVVFDLRDISTTDPNGVAIEDLDESQSFDLVRNGVTATLGSRVDGVPGGQLNQTSSGFGVNAPGGADETDQIDGDEGIESVLVGFDTDVLLFAVDVSSFGLDQASLTIGTNAPGVLDSAGFESNGGVELPQGLTFEVKHISGNGFNFDSFEVLAIVVPQPSTAAALSVPILAWLIRRRS